MSFMYTFINVQITQCEQVAEIPLSFHVQGSAQTVAVEIAYTN